MTRRLPPLQTLRAFEAAARHLNFRRAAEELHLTPSAISHQIALLEDRLGRELFARRGRTTLLEPAGQALASALREAFDAMSAALDAASARREPPGLTVSTLPSFAASWLLPRLPRFAERHPDMPFNLQATVALADFAADGVMIAVRYGKGRWPGLVAERLLDEVLFPVCAPRFAGGRLPRRPADLADLPLLSDSFHPWALWLAPLGLDDLPLDVSSNYSDSALLVEAAAQGLGVALGRQVLAAQRLAEGKLVRPFPDAVPSPNAYYVVYPESLGREARVRAFRDWLFEEAARFVAELPAAARVAAPRARRTARAR